MISHSKILLALLILPSIRCSYTEEEAWKYGIASSIFISCLGWIMAILLIIFTKLNIFTGEKHKTRR
jgi:hypothetical protein